MGIEPLLGTLPAEWSYTTLAEACAQSGGGIQTGPFGSQLHKSDYVTQGVPSIMPTNIGDNKVLADGIAMIRPEDAQRLSRYLVKKGDIVYSRRGDVEKRALISEHEEGWLCGTGCLRVRLGDSGPNPTYTSYYLGHPAVRAWIVRHAHGATMPNLNTSILGSLPLVLPPLFEQEWIADILSSIDDKIELNRRMSETLEEIARTLFDHWLLDTSTANTIASEEHQAGTTFADVVHEHKEKWLPVKDEVVDHHSLPAFDSGAQAVREHSSSIKSTKTLVPRGAILVSRLNPRIPRVWLTDVSDVVPAVASTEFLVTTAKEPFGRSYLYLLASSRAFQQSLASMATGTSGSHQRVRPASVMGLHVPTAPAPELARLEATLGPLLDRIAVARRESKTLADLLDALLPQLISGELRVPEAEQLVSEVA